MTKIAKTCKTCKRAINKNEKSYDCISCGCYLHMTTQCTGLTPVAVKGIVDFGERVLLLCNYGMSGNKRDTLTRNAALQSAS